MPNFKILKKKEIDENETLMVITFLKNVIIGKNYFVNSVSEDIIKNNDVIEF